MILLLVGCGPGELDAEEAQAVFQAVQGVNADVWAFLYDASAPEGEADDTTPGPSDTADTGPWDTAWDLAAPKSVLWHTESGGGGTFEGSFSGLGSWTGDVALTGSYEPTLEALDEWSQVWDMRAAWAEVRFGELRLEADFDWDVSATYDAGAFAYTARVEGQVESRGGATGAGALDYLTEVQYTGGRYLVATTGTVGGHDISETYDATGFGL